MKQLFFLILFSTTTITFTRAAGESPKKINPVAAPGASFQKMWIDYGVTEENRYGMKIHVAFSVYNMKGVTGQLALYFKYNDGTTDSWIKHRVWGGKYHSPQGHLAVSTTVTPTYDASVYEDIELFMPYDEFNLDPGTYDLTIDVQFKHLTGEGIAWLHLYDIEFTQPDKTRGANNLAASAKFDALPVTGPRAIFDTMWVDYDVKEGDVLGMRLHFKFTAIDMKDVEASVAVYFEYDDAQGGVLTDRNGKYSSSRGDVALFKDINPAYAETVYDDLQVFMPYDELELAAGTYNLLMDTKLIYRKGGLISKFTYKAFKYTEPAR